MHVALVGAEFEENLAVRYLWGALERAGHRVSLVVFNGPEELEPAATALASSDAALAGLSMVFTHRARQFAELASRARALGFAGHLVAGGHFAALNPEPLLDELPALDAVAIGEGEDIICALAAALGRATAAGAPATSRCPAALGGVAGLVWRGPAGLVRNAPAEKPPDLDALAVPPRKQPLDDYLGLPITNLLSSRGCGHACAFCSIAAWHRVCGGARLRLRAVERVADEMAALYRRGARIFNFHDDNFFLPDRAARLARFEALGAALTARGVGRIAFAVKSRPDTIDDQTIALLRRMGLFRVFLGIEAGTEQSLRQLGRRQSLADNVAALEVLGRHGVHTCFNLLLLNPDSSLEDLRDNVAFLRAHPDFPVNFCRTEIYAGTPLERRLRKQGRLRGDMWGYDYRIADDRAQAAYEVVFGCFEARNFTARGLHHRNMQVDYEHQLLEHFFGTSAALRQQVKRFVRRVNLDTASHLEAILDALGDEAPSPEQRERLIALHAPRVEQSGRRLERHAAELIEAIGRQAAGTRRSSRVWINAAAAAGIAASLAVAACKDTTHPTEMAPIPTEPAPGGSTYPTEMAPGPPDLDRGGGIDQPLVPIPEQDAGGSHMVEMVAPPPQPDAGGVPPLAPESLLPPSLRGRLRAIVARAVTPPQDVELEVWFDAVGRVARVALRGANLRAPSVSRVGEQVGAIVTRDSLVRGRRFVLKLSAAELSAAGTHTHMHEKAPPPPPPTHPHERAPRPPGPTHPFEDVPPPPPPQPTHVREMAPPPPPKKRR